MVLQCPGCGSKHLRSSLTVTSFEKLQEWLGIVQVRCKDCDHRFRNVIWDAGNILNARCPRCYNLELATWKPERYRICRSWKIKMALGAKPCRCQACRFNFVSFRRLRSEVRDSISESSPCP